MSKILAFFLFFTTKQLYQLISVDTVKEDVFTRFLIAFAQKTFVHQHPTSSLQVVHRLTFIGAHEFHIC